ncbi:hypothetical protein PV328_008356 [Microctonus aethiopoides]|uniref:Uncharacterized protein n=1 Tax=Microctonus aethiopoides TaxID=144406 RepID=A0AA39FJA2_9HYME|nr:hypothetical protein PV328_008356 [Microctonus aethiopoides]
MASPMKIESRSMDDKQTTTKRKVFNDIWLENKMFQDWLCRSSNENKALCSFCEMEMACKKTTLITHAKSKKHIKKSLINKQIITELFDLVNLDATDCSALKLYGAFESSFEKRNVSCDVAFSRRQHNI